MQEVQVSALLLPCHAIHPVERKALLLGKRENTTTSKQTHIQYTNTGPTGTGNYTNTGPTGTGNRELVPVALTWLLIINSYI